MRSLSVMMLLITALVGLPRIAATQAGVHEALERFAGRFDNPLDDDGAAAIERAIVEGISDMNAMRRFIAERRLRENNPPIPRVNVALAGSGVTVDYSGGRRHATQALDTWFRTSAPDGGRLEVRHRLEGGSLVQSFRERNGGADHVFTLSADGTRLDMRATISSPHIPRPITYHLVLERML